MADKIKRITPTGNMDGDSDPRYVGVGNNQGDYIHARNIQKVSQDGSVQGSVEPTLGTEFALNLGSVSQQNKRYRITFDGDVTKQHQLRFLSTQRDMNMAVGTGINGAVQFNGTVASFIAAFNLAILGSGVTWYQTSTATTVEIELTAYAMYQWYLENVGVDDVSVVCIREAIPVDLAGPLKDIGHYDLLGDLFIFSTTQDNEPTEIEAQIIAVLPQSGGVPNTYIGPMTAILFDAPHGLVLGQWIRISNCNELFLNGLFVVSGVPSDLFIQVPTSCAWGATPLVTTIGTPRVFIHPTGIGEIGVARKDESADTWTYTRLLRSVELNFVSKWQIDSESHKDSAGVNNYYSDDYNVPRKFFYSGDYVQDGALNFVSPENIYHYDSLVELSALLINKPITKIKLVSQVDFGGLLTSGNKYYFVSVTNYSNDQSLWSSSSGPIEVFDGLSSSPTRVFGNDNMITLKVNNLIVYGLNPLLDKSISVAVLENISGVLSAKIFIRDSEVTSNEFLFSHSGREFDQELVDVAELIYISQSFRPIKAKSIRSIDYRCVLSNIVTIESINLSEWTKTFKHSINKKFIRESTGLQIGEYQEPLTLSESRGFMLNETYRIGCRASIKGIGITDIFYVDDIKVSPDLINSSNPTDNRRVQGTLMDYDLVEEMVQVDRSLLNASTVNTSGFPEMGSQPTAESSITGNPNDPGYQDQLGVKWASGWGSVNNEEWFIGAGSSSVNRLIVPIITIEEIDYTFEIEGIGSVRDHVTALEFFIGDVPICVQASGMGVMTVGERANQSPVNGVNGGVQLDDRFDGGSEGIAFAAQRSDVNDRYLFEYPFATGSSKPSPGDPSLTRGNYGDVAVNYPVRRVANNDFDGSAPSKWRYISRQDIISFYSGDTLFRDTYNTSSKLIVFGAIELAKNHRSKPLPYNQAIFPTGPLNSGFWHDISCGYFAKFQPRKTKNSYVEYPILQYDFISPDEIPSPSDINLNDVNGGSPWGAPTGINAQSGGDLGAIKIGNDYFSKIIPVQIPNVTTAPASATTQHPGGNEANGVMANQKGPVVLLSSIVDLYDTNLSPSYVNEIDIMRYSNRGVIYCQLYNDNLSNYPSRSDTKYHSIGTMLTLSESSGNALVSLDLDCGDTMTQTTIIKHRYDKISKEEISVAITSGLSDEVAYSQFKTGFGSMISLTCQNRINANMRLIPEYDPANLPEFTFQGSFNRPQYPRDQLARYISSYGFESPLLFSETYKNYLNIRIDAYNSRTGIFGALYDLPSRVLWSQNKGQEGVGDEYRIFLPLNFKDLDLTFGEIFHHENVNGELFTLQPRKWQSQLFNTRGQIEVSGNAIGAIIGDGSVLSRDGQTLSRYGTQNKWSAILGVSSSGKDVLYWFNAENGLFMRFSQEGTVVLSDSKRMRAFSSKAAKWLRGKDTPAYDQGIRGVWDDRSKEAIWTFTGWRDILQAWASGAFIEVGEIVTNENAPSNTYEDLPRFFTCKEVHSSTPANEPGVGADWAVYWNQIPYTDQDYYSVFTIAYNETTSGFSTFYGHIPKTYLKWRDTFLSSHPTIRNLLFEHRRGLPTTWYGVNTFLTGNVLPKVEDAVIEMVINDMPEQSIKGVAVGFLTDRAPDRIDYETKRHETYSEAVDFEQRDDQYFAPIRGDVSQGQLPEMSEEMLSGDYMKVRFTIFGGTYNLLHSIFVKVRDRARRINT